MKKIALISHTPNLSGAEKMILNLAILLSKDDIYKPLLFIPNMKSGLLHKVAMENNIECIDIQNVDMFMYIYSDIEDKTKFSRFANSSFNNKNIFKKYLLENNIELVILNTLTNISTVLACIELNLPFITWIHGIIDSTAINDTNENFNILIDRVILSLSSSIICCSQWTKNFYEEFSDSEKILTIDNWTSNDAISSIKSDTKFVCLSSFNSNKGLYKLIKASQILKKKGERFFVEIYGDGPEKNNMIKKIKEYDLEKYLILKSYTTDIKNVYNSCLAVIQPSFIESFGMTIIESMSFARPVISARSGGPQNLITDGYDGFLINIDDEVALSEKMEFLLNNPDRADIMGQNGYDTYKKRFSIKSVEKQIKNVFIKTLDHFDGYSSNNLLHYDLLMSLINVGKKLQKYYIVEKDNTASSNIINPATKFIDLSKLIASKKITREKPKRSYKVLIESKSISSISVIFGTHCKKSTGSIKIDLIDIYQKKVLRTASLDLAEISDNGWATFNFDTIKDAYNKKFIIKFHLKYENDNYISIYEIKGKFNYISSRFSRKNKLYYLYD